MLVTMKELLDKASAGNYAVAAPNVSNELNARACIEAAEDMKAPLILDVAYMAAVDIQFLGEQLRRLAEQSSVEIAINLDHGASLEQVMAAIRAGFTSVMIDRSACPDEENIRDVSEIVRIAHAVGVSVEAELGHVGDAMHYYFLSCGDKKNTTKYYKLLKENKAFKDEKDLERIYDTYILKGCRYLEETKEEAEGDPFLLAMVADMYSNRGDRENMQKYADMARECAEVQVQAQKRESK